MVASLTVDWQAAQAMELATWRDLICTSPALIYDELLDAAAHDAFLRARHISYTRVVDLGVGPLGIGWVAAFGQGRPDDLHGFGIPCHEFSHRRVLPSSTTSCERLQQRITFTQSRAEDQALPARSFDLVICDNVVDHTEQPQAVLHECRRLLVPGGMLAFGVNAFSTVGHLKWNHWTRRRHPVDPNTIMHPHSYTERTLDRLLREGGWRIVASDHSLVIRRAIGRAYRFRILASPGPDA